MSQSNLLDQDRRPVVARNDNANESVDAATSVERSNGGNAWLQYAERESQRQRLATLA